MSTATADKGAASVAERLSSIATTIESIVAEVSSLVIEAERGEWILGLRNGFALSDFSESVSEIVGQW